jgi:hypothetical protein
MKTSIIIASTAIGCIGLSAFGLIDWSTPETPTQEVKEETSLCAKTTSPCSKVTEKVVVKESKEEVQVNFHIGVGTRFSGFTKSDIQKVHSFTDFMTEDEMKIITAVNSIKVVVIEDDVQTEQRLFVEGNLLSAAQKQMMRNFDYSTHFVVSADCMRKNLYTGELERSQYRPHHTLIPDVPAQYEGGFETLVAHFRKNSSEVIKEIDSKKLTPAKIYFTVTKDGKITNIKLDRTTSYAEIDQKMVELVTDMPNNWTPAENDKGENVDQELTCIFGVIGC